MCLRAPNIYRLLQCNIKQLTSRIGLHTSQVCTEGAYEGDGKTKVTIFNTDPELGLMITGYSQYGFRLNNNMVIMGPMAIFPRSVLSWNVNTFEDVNADSLSLFFTIQPKIDLLILGLGDNVPAQVFSKGLVQAIRKHNINIEILRTEQACATFNFLSAEQRMVAAAMIPPLHITYNEMDVAKRAFKGDTFRSND